MLYDGGNQNLSLMVLNLSKLIDRDKTGVPTERAQTRSVDDIYRMAQYMS